jgi:hypothetical protein
MIGSESNTLPPVTAPESQRSARLKKAFCEHYIYAGLGTTLTATQVGNHS